MSTASAIVSILLAAAITASGVATLLKAPPIVASITAVGWPEERLWVLGVLKLAGAVGLVVGLWVAPLGIAAGLGVALYFVGAVVFHVRAKNDEIAPAVGLLVLAVVAVVLRGASA